MSIQLFIHDPGIGLVDHSDLIAYRDQFNFALIRGERGTANISLQFLAADSYEATVGSQLYLHEITDGPTDTVVYAGNIRTIERKWIGNDGVHVDTLICTTLESCFDVIRVPPFSFFEQSAGTTVTQIFNDFCSGVPVTLGDIEPGVTIEAVVTRWGRVSDIFQDLATQSALIWGVQMSDSTLYFRERDTVPAPFVLESYLFQTGEWKVDETDYRNRQLIQISFRALQPANEVIAGDGFEQTLVLRDRVDSLVSAVITQSTQAAVTGIFGTLFPLSGAIPTAGDTFTITAGGDITTYTWEDALDNTLQFQVLIGATADDCAQNAVDAINAKPSRAGLTYSWPTWPNQTCNADQPVGTSFVLKVKLPGSGGNAVSVSSAGGAFSWDGEVLSPVLMSGGTEGGITSSLSTGIFQSGVLGADIQYTVGGQNLFAVAPIPVGASLSVSYYRLGADTIAVEDSAAVATRAAIEGGSGEYMQMITDTQQCDPKVAYQQAVATLAAYATLPASFQFTVDQPLLSPGQLLTITIVSPDGAPALLDGVWLVQEVQGNLVPGMEDLPEPYGHFRYTVSVINTREIKTYIDFFRDMAKTTPPVPPSPITPPSVATNTLQPITPGSPGSGTPASGTPQVSAGAQWVQEQLGLTITNSNNDLLMASSSTVSSAGYDFQSSDVGTLLVIAAASGWTPGSYPITSVSAGVATITGSPASSGTTGGLWGTATPGVYQFSWVPSKSMWTANQIAIVMLMSPNGDSPLTYTPRQLTPFAYDELGYAITAVGPGGPDYNITSDQLTLRDVPPSDDIVLTEYFPAGIGFPKRKAGDAQEFIG